MLILQLVIAVVGRFLYSIFFGWYIRWKASRDATQKVEIKFLKAEIDALRKRIEIERLSRKLTTDELSNRLRSNDSSV